MESLGWSAVIWTPGVVGVGDIIILSLRLSEGARNAKIFLGSLKYSLADGNPFDSSALAI